MDMLNTTIIPEDVKIIRGILVVNVARPYFLGWHYTKSGKYIVKSGYQNEQRNMSSDQSIIFGPNVRSLEVKSWKIHFPPKLKHLIWQVITGC